MVTKEMTWLMVETHDTETCHKDCLQVWGIACTLDLISPQVLAGVPTRTISVIIILLPKTLQPSLRDIRKYEVQNRDQAVKLVLNYSHRYKKLRSGVDKYWLRHRVWFNDLSDKH